jgi:anaphase-promoting complex subunit 5
LPAEINYDFAKLRGDEKVAEEWAMRHNLVWDEGYGSQEM